MKYLFLILICTSCGSFGTLGILKQRTKPNPKMGQIGFRDKDIRARSFGITRSIGSSISTATMTYDNPHEIDILSYAITCAQSKGMHFDRSVHTAIITEYLSEHEANNVLTVELGKVIKKQDIGSVQIKSHSGDEYTEKKYLIKPVVTYHNEISRAICRLYNPNLGGAISYGIAVFDKSSFEMSKGSYINLNDLNDRKH